MKFIHLAVAIPLIAAALQSCSGPAARSDRSANAFLGLESRLVDLKAAWIESDLKLLSATCPRMKPQIRSQFLEQGNTAGVDDYDARKRTCDSLPKTRSSLARLRGQSADATSGDAFEDVQRELEELRAQTDVAIQQFPTPSFGASNFPPGAASEYRAKHEALARDAGKLAADAVAAARDASGAAMAQARSTDHELDKARARLADDGYTRAASDLQQLSTMTSAPDIVARVTVIFSEVDGAIGTAQGTGRVGGNPVDVAHEAVPAAEPTIFTTPTHAPPVLTAVGRPAAPELASAQDCTTVISDPQPPTNIRSAPNGPVIAKLENGVAITVDDDRHDWLRISAPTAGWVHKSVTRMVCATPDPSIAGTDASGSWPAGQTAYTVILSSVSTRNEAQAKAGAFRAKGTSVGILHSDDFVSLRSGYWVVFSGQYRDIDAAQNAAKAARSLTPDAYAKQIVPR